MVASWILLLGIVPIALFAGLALTWRRRALAAEEAERRAVDRRDRFLAEAAGELALPLEHLCEDLARSTAGRELVPRVERLRVLIAELARLPHLGPVSSWEALDLAGLVRQLLDEPPFRNPDGTPARRPTVVVRARAAPLLGDRTRLSNGLRLLFWLLQRDADELAVTVGGDEGAARLVIDRFGGRGLAEAFEELPAVTYGLRARTSAPESTLALLVASEVVRVHGGRLSASPRAGRGERFVLDLPAREGAQPLAQPS